MIVFYSVFYSFVIAKKPKTKMCHSGTTDKPKKKSGTIAIAVSNVTMVIAYFRYYFSTLKIYVGTRNKPICKCVYSKTIIDQ